MLDAVNFSRNCPNLPLSDPVGIWLLLFLWLVHSQQGKGWPHHPLRAEASHWQWNEFDGVYMPLETSFAVARGGEDATENWRRLFLTRIQFIHSWRLPNRWRCCREIGVVVSPFIKRSYYEPSVTRTINFIGSMKCIDIGGCWYRYDSRLGANVW